MFGPRYMDIQGFPFRLVQDTLEFPGSQCRHHHYRPFLCKVATIPPSTSSLALGVHFFSPKEIFNGLLSRPGAATAGKSKSHIVAHSLT